MKRLGNRTKKMKAIKTLEQYSGKHFEEAIEFCKGIEHLCTDPDMLFVDVAASSSIYITLYCDADQSSERIYRFADHANCRRYTNAKNVAPGVDSVADAIADASAFIGSAA
jgi:hypothetical protein